MAALELKLNRSLLALTRCRQAAEQPESEQDSKRDINEQPRHSLQRFADPESHGEIEDQYTIIEPATKQHVSSHRFGRREVGLGKLAIQGEIGQQREQADGGPADIIGHWHTIMDARIGIVVNLAKKPAIAKERDWIDDDIDKRKKEGREQHEGPARSRGERELHADDTDAGTGASCGQQKGKGHAITRKQKKHEREGIHERDVCDIQFLADRRTSVEVPTERNTDASGRELAHKCHDPGDGHEVSRPPPADQAARYEQEDGEKHKNIGAEDSRLEQEVEEFHWFQVRDYMREFYR